MRAWLIRLETYQAEVAKLTAQLAEARADVAAAKDLLAVVHRDGGHHTERVGFAQACADARGAVCNMRAELAEARDRLR